MADVFLDLSHKENDTMFILFRGWYEDSVIGYITHRGCVKYYHRWGSLITYILIPLTALALLIGAIEVILQQSIPSVNFIYFTIVNLVVQFIIFCISLANSVDHQTTAFEHMQTSNAYKRLSEDIIKLLTPLSRTELDINLSDVRTQIQQRLGDLQNTKLIIPSSISNGVDWTRKLPESEYKKLMKIYESLTENTNELFAPIQQQVLTENLNFSMENLSPDVPMLQQQFDDLRSSGD